MTSPAVAEFITISESIAQSFVQTVVMVDDRAFESVEPLAKPAGPPPSPVRPRFTATKDEQALNDRDTVVQQNAVADSDDQEEVVIEQAATPEETSEDAAHRLDAKRAIEQFANKGIVCAVLRPSEIEMDQFESKLCGLAEVADALIFDWVWFEDVEGKKVSEVITNITNQSSQQHRLRLILIYTGEKDLKLVIDDLARILTQNGVQNTRTDDFTINSAGTRITVYSKGNIELSDEVLRSRVSPPDQLPNTVVAEFAKLTSGLLSNVALFSLAAVRSNTHRILSRFRPELDAPFLSHRAMLPQPEDANALLVQLIGGELTAILDGHEVGGAADSFLGVNMLKAWIDARKQDGYEFAKRFSAGKQTDVLDQLNTLLRDGVSSDTLHAPFDSFKKDPQKRDLTQKLAIKDTNAEELEHRFAVLTTLKSNYRSSTHPPLLVPGTLVKKSGEEGRPNYLICIQPICDCVRLDETRTFPFLQLRAPTDKDAAFDLVLPDNETYVRLRVDYSPYRSKLIDFKPSTTVRAIVSEVNEGRIQFTAMDGTLFDWIGELKVDQTQRIVNNYAAQIARVGLDESEWLRRWAKR